MQDRITRLEQALSKLTTEGSPSSTGHSVVHDGSAAVTPLPAHQKAWTESASFVERDPSFEHQSLLASQSAELSNPTTAESAEFADQVKTLNAVSHAPMPTRSRREPTLVGSGSDHILKREQIPAAFVLRIVRILECKSRIILALCCASSADYSSQPRPRF